MSNGLNGNGKPRIDMGAVDLTAAMLNSRVTEIVVARMSEGFSEPPVVKRMIQIALEKGRKASEVSEPIVRDAVATYFWQMVGELRSYGIDANDGEFSIEEGQTGQAPPDGRPCVVIPLVWRHRAIEESKPPLSIVAP